MFYLYSKSTKYAILTLIYLAQQAEGRFVKVRDIACSCDIPVPYLSKLITQLRSHDIINSLRGPTGGIHLTRRPSEITLTEIIDSVSDTVAGKRRCLLGLGNCGCQPTCAMHEHWKKIKNRIEITIESQTLEEIANIPTESTHI